MTIQWNEEAQRLSELCIDLRRQLHRHPELSSHEEQTVALIDQFLQAQGIRTQIVEHGGVLGWIEGGKPGRTVMLRADIDALPDSGRKDQRRRIAESVRQRDPRRPACLRPRRSYRDVIDGGQAASGTPGGSGRHGTVVF